MVVKVIISKFKISLFMFQNNRRSAIFFRAHFQLPVCDANFLRRHLFLASHQVAHHNHCIAVFYGLLLWFLLWKPSIGNASETSYCCFFLSLITDKVQAKILTMHCSQNFPIGKITIALFLWPTANSISGEWENWTSKRVVGKLGPG